MHFDGHAAFPAVRGIRSLKIGPNPQMSVVIRTITINYGILGSSPKLSDHLYQCIGFISSISCGNLHPSGMGSRGGFGSLPRYFPPYPFRGQLPTREPKNQPRNKSAGGCGCDETLVFLTVVFQCFSYLGTVGQLAFQSNIWPSQTEANSID